MTLEIVYFLVGLVLIRFKLLAQLHLFLKVIFKLIRHLVSTVPVGLQPTQFLHAILASLISVCDCALNVDVIITLPIDVYLETAIDLICIVVVI